MHEKNLFCEHLKTDQRKILNMYERRMQTCYYVNVIRKNKNVNGISVSGFQEAIHST